MWKFRHFTKVLQSPAHHCTEGVDESGGEVEEWRRLPGDWVGSGGAPVAFTPGTAGTQDQLFVIILSRSGRHYKYIVWKPELQHIVMFPELLSQYGK